MNSKALAKSFYFFIILKPEIVLLLYVIMNALFVWWSHIFITIYKWRYKQSFFICRPPLDPGSCPWSWSAHLKRFSFCFYKHTFLLYCMQISIMSNRVSKYAVFVTMHLLRICSTMRSVDSLLPLEVKGAEEFSDLQKKSVVKLDLTLPE